MPKGVPRQAKVGIGDGAVATAEPEGVKPNGETPLVEELVGKSYAVEVEIVGRTPMLFHAWNSAAVEEKSKAAKGGRAKRTDNIESYVYRDPDGYLCVPAGNIWACLSDTARSVSDPRSPRKSLRDVVRAGLRIEPLAVPLLPKSRKWDYEDRRRVTVQRAAITRARPAVKEGWRLRFTINVVAGDYLSPEMVNDLVVRAGRFTGLNDFRPLFGLFQLTHFQVRDLKV